jgi:thymidylate synthase
MTWETQYLDLLRDILDHGESRDDRTGVGTWSLFAPRALDIDLSRESVVPLVTTKKMPWKTVVRELLWFLRGSTDSRELEAQGVTIWKGNTTRTFLDGRGLMSLPEGDIGAGYGFQWRHFGAPYKTCESQYQGQGVDQITGLIESIRNDPQSRRHLLTAWNPAALKDTALPPCHVLAQFYVSSGGGLSCHLYQRSADCFLGLPFNIFSYAVLTHLLAKWTGTSPKRLVISLGDAHVYKNHVNVVREQIARTPLNAPRLRIREGTSLDSISMEDFALEDYACHDKLSGAMAV